MARSRARTPRGCLSLGHLQPVRHCVHLGAETLVVGLAGPLRSQLRFLHAAAYSARPSATARHPRPEQSATEREILWVWIGRPLHQFDDVDGDRSAMPHLWERLGLSGD
jgi:hypothetical protein